MLCAFLSNAISTALRENTRLTTLNLGWNNIANSKEQLEIDHQITINNAIQATLTKNNFVSVAVRNQLLSMIQEKVNPPLSSSSLPEEIVPSIRYKIECPSLIEIAFNELSNRLADEKIAITTARLALPSSLFEPTIEHFFKVKNKQSFSRLRLFKQADTKVRDNQNDSVKTVRYVIKPL